MVCFGKFPLAKKFMDKNGGGVSRFSVKNFLSHSSKNFRRGTIQWFSTSGYRKMLGTRGGGGGFTFFRRRCLVSEYRNIS